MRRIVGKNTIATLDKSGFDELLDRYPGAILDIGTGDGKHPLQLAKRHPDRLVIGLDAAKDNLRRSAAKASDNPKRGGLPNLIYVWAAAEQLPVELHGITEVHVLMPWGSLLRGVLGSDPAMLRGIAALCEPDARFLVTLNLHAWRPPVPEVGEHAEPTPDSAETGLGPAWRAAGWQLDTAEYLDAAGIEALATSWTKRLGSSRSELDVLALTGTVNPVSAPG